MSLKNGNTVALERRMDLASLFCMIGRHGPAVALAVIAVVSVVAGFIIYRSVRGKRRKATAGGDAGESPGAEKDAALIHTEPETCPEELRSSAESTDVSDEGSSDATENADLNIRHRRAAAEKKPSPDAPPQSDSLVDTKQKDASAVQDFYEAEEANQRRDAHTVAEEERDGDEGSLKPELVYDGREEEKVLPAQRQEGENATADTDVYDEKTSQEEESLQCVLESPVCCEQTTPMSANKEPDDEATPDTNNTEPQPGVHLQDVLVSCTCSSKDAEFEEENPEDIAHSNYDGNDRLCPEEELKHGEVEKALVDDQGIAQESEVVYSTSEQETRLPSSQEELCDDVAEEVVLSSQDGDRDGECGQTSEVIQEKLHEDILSNLADIVFDAHPLQQQRQTEPESEKGLACDEEDDVGKSEMLRDGSNMVLAAPLAALNQPEKVEDALCGTTTDANAQNSGTGDFPDLPSDYQRQQREVTEEEISPVLDKDTELDVPASDLTSFKEEVQSEKNETGSVVVLAEESVDQEPSVPSSQLGRCGDVMAEVVRPSQDSDQNDEHSPAAEATEEAIHEDHLNNLAHVRFEVHTLQQQLQTEPKNGVTCNQEEGVVKRETLASCDGSGVALAPALPEEFDIGDDGLCGTTADAKAEIPAVELPELSLDYQQSHVEEDETAAALDTNSDPNTLSFALTPIMEEIQSNKNETDAAVLLAEELVDHVLSSCYKDLQSDRTGSDESLDRMGADPAAAAALCDEASVSPPVTSTEISHLDLPSSFQDRPNDQMQSNPDFPELTASAAPIITESNKPPICEMQLPAFEQSELTWSSSGLGGESGISSMTVSPDLEDPASKCHLSPENVELPVMHYDQQSEVQTKAQTDRFVDDVALSVVNEDAAGVVTESCPSHLSQQPHSEPTDRANDESFLSNEDTFGCEIEDRYNRAMDQLMVQIATSVTPDDKKKETDVKVVKTKKKKEGAKEEEEEEEEDDNERTEISIMEATMDNNEWITEGSYQVLPWMNLSVPSFAQSHTKPDPVPDAEQHHSSSPAEAPCIDTVILLPSIKVTQTNTLPPVDENSKKVVAVQPMPQNVSVTFRIHYHTHSQYQKVAITGNQQELGNWKEFIPLEEAKDGHWSTVVSLPAESYVEWKFVVVDRGNVCRWEECGNRLLDTGSGDDLLVHKWWGIL
ncbi:microtubule-associated protein futsch [Stegastes partitus]|uniref:Starch-binding domain-containing protein 1 n=1 Tax=Stegastes partitus TaxID=144197 RepID=A0A3B5BMX2_9TELE|nr:PREDICTED: starch-binding domain-containing protein 1 [Stegastes partitus]